MPNNKKIDVINDCDYKDVLVDIVTMTKQNRKDLSTIASKNEALERLKTAIYQYDRAITFPLNYESEEIGLPELYKIAVIAIRSICEVNHLN